MPEGPFLHVLVTADTMSGSWTYARELVTGLVTRGVRVTLVTFGEIPLPDQTAMDGSFARLGIPAHSVPAGVDG